MRWAVRCGFSVFLLSLMRLHAADVSFVQVAKAVAYLQANAAAPVLQANPYIFRARVDLTRSNSVSAVSVKWPGLTGVTRALTNEVMYWEYSQIYALSDTLNFSNPNGTYAVYIQGAIDGRKTNVLTLSADGYPATIHIANFAEAQKVNPQNDFKLQWDPNATIPSDIIQVKIFSGEQIVLDTGGIPGAAATLSGAATFYTIPRNTLGGGKVYRVRVSATRKSTADATGYPGVAAWASYSRFTEFTLRTIYPTLDVNWYGIARVRRYNQTSPSAPAPFPSGGYGFSAAAVATDPLNLQSVALKLPNGLVKTLSAAGASWSFNASADTAQQLDTAYAGGTYALDLQTTHNGPQHLSLVLAPSASPPAMQISNWNEASAIDPTAGFALKWAAIPGATADDFVQVTLRKNNQVVFRTADSPATAGALNGIAASVILPPGLLQPGDSAEVTLAYLKSLSLDVFTYPQVLGTVSAGSETHATLRASGGSFPAAIFSAPRSVSGNVELTITCAAGRQQVIQTSADFQQWSDWLLTNAPASSFIVRVPIVPSVQVLGIRVKTN